MIDRLVSLAVHRRFLILGIFAAVVIGGLIASTATTLLVLPAVFALLMGRGKPTSASLDPTDPLSCHYRPRMPATGATPF